MCRSRQDLVDQIYNTLTSQCFYDFYVGEMDDHITGEDMSSEEITAEESRAQIKKRIGEIFQLEDE